MRRKTKILCTLGPSTQTPASITRLIEAGADVLRLNMSHATADWTRQICKDIRAAAKKANREVAILMDLRGPSIRTGDIKAPIPLKVGDPIEFRLDPEIKPTCKASVEVAYRGLAEDVKPGDALLLDNGLIHTRVTHCDPDVVRGQVTTEGTLTSRRHVNLPGVAVGIPALTRKDLADIDLAVDIGEFDFVALSFAREAEHVRQLGAMLEERGSTARVIAKIENHQAIDNLDDIIQASGGVMVARGDLGIECALEEMPLIQRRIIERCSYFGRKCIVATQMLESMIENPSPTRAEVTDIFNAVLEQVDAVMLSGETTVGKYPDRCVEIIDRVARRTELEFPNGRPTAENPLFTDKEKTAKAASDLANSIPGAKILVFTARGVLGHLLAHQRPESAPIYAFSPHEYVVRRLLMARAVFPYLLPFGTDAERMITTGIDLLKKEGLLKKGDPVILLSDVFQGEYEVDSILWRKV